LSAMAGARTLSFEFASSDVGMFGINTPTYLALDNLVLESRWKAGDFNLDGRTDVGDVAAMMSAMSDLSSYQNGANSQVLPLTEDKMLSIGDFDRYGKVTNADLQGLLVPLANAPGGGSLSAVPEPAAAALATIAALVITISWRWRSASAALARGATATTL